jgi:hypothetical protein
MRSGIEISQLASTHRFTKLFLRVMRQECMKLLLMQLLPASVLLCKMLWNKQFLVTMTASPYYLPGSLTPEAYYILKNYFHPPPL